MIPTRANAATAQWCFLTAVINPRAVLGTTFRLYNHRLLKEFHFSAYFSKVTFDLQNVDERRFLVMVNFTFISRANFSISQSGLISMLHIFRIFFFLSFDEI